MQELLTVRHSVFIVGVACTGKTQIWKTLLNTYVQQDRKPIAYDLNPKCVSNSELFGCINSATREWKDGLLSSLMRDQAKYTNDNPKWIMIDGDIDPLLVLLNSLCYVYRSGSNARGISCSSVVVVVVFRCNVS